MTQNKSVNTFGYPCNKKTYYGPQNKNQTFIRDLKHKPNKNIPLQ